MTLAFTELYCDPVSGDNVNAGAPIGGIYPVTSTNGAYTRGAGAGGADLFTAAAGTPFAQCAVGDFVSVRNDGAAAPTPFVGRITAINGAGVSIDISLTAIAGTRPATVGNGKTAVVGGAWKGPNAADTFPLNIALTTTTTALRDSAGHVACVNLKNSANYAPTIAIAPTGTQIGGVVYSGYLLSPRDGGKAIFSGASLGAGFTILNGVPSGLLMDLIFEGVATTAQAAVIASGNKASFWRCVARNNIRGGFSTASSPIFFYECEAYNCGSNSAIAGFLSPNNSRATYIRCIAHNCGVAGIFAAGFNLGSGGSLAQDCISYSNIGEGFLFASSTHALVRCDAYNNGRDGIRCNSSGTHYVENCNLVKNVGYGINCTSSGIILGQNNAFGSGTQQNTLGRTNGFVHDMDSITLPADMTPWRDPVGGDFSLVLAQCIKAGRGKYQYLGEEAITRGFPDIGAAKSR